MSLYDDKDDKKNVTGRKIDLMMCSTGLELSSLEWKKVDTATKLIEEQRAKNTRVNSAILNNILNKYFETKRNDIHIIGMDWLGKLKACKYFKGFKYLHTIIFRFSWKYVFCVEV